ncbi:MAG: tetratricopeptide repeat protein [Magnetococcales bacterium]|nr:tetratricopeptide repeat protein [Magnetococcales bacterium]MBF0149513.1 tetratricopeptide repeat protein [Magnetococcales bacterium]
MGVEIWINETWMWIDNNAGPLGVVLTIVGILVTAYFSKTSTTPGNTNEQSSRNTFAATGDANVQGSYNTSNIGLTAEGGKVLLDAVAAHWQGLIQEQQRVLREQEKRLGVQEGAIQIFFEIILKQNVPPEQWLTKLVEIAGRYNALCTQAQATSVGDATLQQEVRKAIEARRFDDADDLFKRMLEQQGAEMAAVWANRGDLAMIRLRYAEAAQYYATAADTLPPSNKKQSVVWLEKEYDAWFKLGDEFGNHAALATAIQRAAKLLEMHPQDSAPQDWARMQVHLGNALRILGERESGTDKLEVAVEAYREALKEYTRVRLPLDWAMTQNNLGNALSSLGERESGTAKLEEAVHAYREALKEFTWDRVPLDWAATQNNLGNALMRLGERENGTAKMEEAVEAYREALKEYTRDRVPLDWAMTQNNLGNALMRFGERESGTAKLEEAVQAHREALKERTRNRVPLDWAMTQNSLGVALRGLGERERNADRLKDAMTAYQNALDVAQEGGASYYVQLFDNNIQELHGIMANFKENQDHNER